MIRIDLTHVSDVKDFVAMSQSCTASILLTSGKYAVDGKSILGIFSLDLSHSINLICEDENDYPKFTTWFATASTDGGTK